MNAPKRIWAGLRAGCAWLMEPEPWSPNRGSAVASNPGFPAVPRRGPAAELLVALVLALTAVGFEELLGEGWPRMTAVALGAAAVSLLRRRLPVPMLLVSAPLAGAVGGFALVSTVVAWSAGRRIEGAGRALAAFTIAYVLYAGGALVTGWSESMSLVLALMTTLTFLATDVVPGLAGRYWSQRRTLLHALRERNAQLLWERQMVAGQARLLERQRIAQDMHDSLGHQLALISVHTGALEVDPQLTARQREAVGVLRDASVAAMHELREVVGILRDGVESSQAPGDETGRAARGTAGIDALVEASMAAGNTLRLRRTGDARPLAPAADNAAYRIVQEALTNAYKHAPGAPIDVELRYEPDSLVVEIVNGVADPDAYAAAVSGGQGLTGLSERARLVGGIVHAGPADGGGFRVAGMLPYAVVEAAPFVAPGDDFHRQSATAPHGHGVPVTNWDLAKKEPTMSELDGSRRSGIGAFELGCGISLVAVFLVAAAGAVGGFALAPSKDEAVIDQAKYDSLKLGSDEDEVRDKLPRGESFVNQGLDDDEKTPRKPEGSTCLVVMSEEAGSEKDTEPVFRFCFKDGKLIEKKAYEVRL